MVISSPCLTDIKNWLVQSKRFLLASPEKTASALDIPEQTASGKDFLNPLIVDSLLKTIWLSMHHVVTMKHWLFQSKQLLFGSIRAAQRATEIRSRPPTKSQLRNLMMTYLKNMGGYKHSQLKANTFEEIQAMYERQKKKITDFKPMDSDDAVKDCKKAAGESSEKVLDVSKKRKGGPRMKRMSKRKKTESDLKEEEGLKTFLKIVPDKEGIIDYEVLKKRFPIINWESKFYHYDRHGAEGIYYRIFRYDGSSRWIKTFSEMVTRFDRLDLVELYNLVMQRFEIITSKGVDLVLWGDLRIMVHTLTLEDGTEIHMLAERKYPLTKETLKRMMSLKLIAESASDSAYDLLRFIQKQIDKAGSYDGGKKDL
ncbi:hypothetical protein Tco_0152518 [Tanacetum coccineum]